MADASSIHPSALCDATDVGVGVEIGAFAFVAARCVLGDHSSIGAGAKVLEAARIETNASLGANAVVGAGVVIGRGAVVEAGAFVTEAVPANAVVRGNPATIVGYVGSEADAPLAEPVVTRGADVVPSRVHNVRVQALARGRDLRGDLMAVEFGDLPFPPVRAFTVSGVSSEHVRGSHAHRECDQFLVCVTGAVSCVLDDGRAREEFRLEGPEFGIYMPAMTWGTQYKYSADATLLVLASHPYDPADYIRDYDEFLLLAATLSSRLRDT
jgi:carbonic anhydrase/acetyltransferase-like protein (isoleucine patch superfamily)